MWEKPSSNRGNEEQLPSILGSGGDEPCAEILFLFISGKLTLARSKGNRKVNLKMAEKVTQGGRK